ncbi:hypothetical protein ONA91_12965 [Micromonospora sp. DR5-3]|uniref:hypothetical protein n=1 Tax=unclassified Micromonospora TaxID=2617518 RepID=UPI0011D83FD6|nr:MULTISPECIES: hypothetical protein [unclassified Micromonospora]MCW3815366.1 hypothetical protein [Micromonospora sp. DR5-3]TYC22821.1 hypothetical protein FXF52_18680 [Micromonospora sp. MP36]
MERPTVPDAARVALAWLGHPVTVLALVVLVLNDHVLKAAQPGWLTGKLSDVAGLVLAPPLVAALVALAVPRIPARAAAGLGLGLVGIGFTVVKTSGYAAAAASSAWSVVSGPSLVRADRTDLLALPALALAGWTWRRARRDPVGRRPARLVRLLVLLPAATLAVAATSAVWYFDAARATVVDGRLAAGIGESRGADISSFGATWRVSDDGGETWRDPTAAEEQRLDPRFPPSSGSPAAPPSATPSATPTREDCSAATPQRCYRLAAGRIRVEESDDAGRTWRLAWEVTEEQRAILSRRYQDAGPRGERIAGQELTVLDVGAGRHVVLVANGRDGFAVRGPDGDWRRIGFTGGPYGGGPPPLGASSPADRHADPLRAGLLAFALAELVLVVAAARAGRLVGRGGWLPALLGALTVGTVLPLSAVWLSDDLFAFVAALGCVVLLLGTPLLALIPHWVWRAPGRWTLEVLLAAALTLVLAGLPLTGWLYGRPAYVSTAVALAGLAAVPGLLLGWRAARLVGSFEPLADPPYPPAVPHPARPVRPPAPR